MLKKVKSKVSFISGVRYAVCGMRLKNGYAMEIRLVCTQLASWPYLCRFDTPGGRLAEIIGGLVEAFMLSFISPRRPLRQSNLTP